MFACKAAIEGDWSETVPSDGMVGILGEFCLYRVVQTGRGNLRRGQPEPVSSYLYKQNDNSGSSTIASLRLRLLDRSMRSEEN